MGIEATFHKGLDEHAATLRATLSVKSTTGKGTTRNKWKRGMCFGSDYI